MLHDKGLLENLVEGSFWKMACLLCSGKTFLLATVFSACVVSFASNTNLNIQVSSSDNNRTLNSDENVLSEKEYHSFQNSNETKYPRSATYKSLNLRDHSDGVSSFSSPLYVLDPPIKDATSNTNVKHSVLLVRQNPKYGYNNYPSEDDGKEYIYSELESPGHVTGNVLYSNQQGYIMRDKTSMSSPMRHFTPAHLDHSIFTLPDHWTKSSSALTHTPNKVTTRLSDSLDQINISSQGSWNQQETQEPEPKYDMTTRQPVHKRHPESYTSIFSSTRFHNSVKNTHVPSENIVLTDNHKPFRSNLISPSWRTKVGVGLNNESTNGLLNIFNHQNPNKGSSFEQPKHSATTTPTLINSEYLSTSNLDTPSHSLSQHQESISEITSPKVKLQLEPLIALSNSDSTTFDTIGNLNSDIKPVDNNDGNGHSITSQNSIENVAFQANYSHELEDTLEGLLSNAVHFPVSDTLASISEQHKSEDSINLLNSPDSLVTSNIADPTSPTIFLSQSTDSSSKTSSTDSSSETFQSDASHTTLSSAVESPTLISWIRFLLVGIVMMMVPPAFTEINAIVSSLATG